MCRRQARTHRLEDDVLRQQKTVIPPSWNTCRLATHVLPVGARRNAVQT